MNPVILGQGRAYVYLSWDKSGGGGRLLGNAGILGQERELPHMAVHARIIME